MYSVQCIAIKFQIDLLLFPSHGYITLTVNAFKGLIKCLIVDKSLTGKIWST